MLSWPSATSSVSSALNLSRVLPPPFGEEVSNGVSMVRPSFHSYLWDHLETVKSIILKDEPFLSLKELHMRASFLIWKDYESRFQVSLDVVGLDSSEGPAWERIK